MTNRDMIMIRLIQLSPERFAEMMNDHIQELMEDRCPVETSDTDGNTSDLVEWLQQKAS